MLLNLENMRLCESSSHKGPHKEKCHLCMGNAHNRQLTKTENGLVVAGGWGKKGMGSDGFGPGVAPSFRAQIVRKGVPTEDGWKRGA